MPPCTTTTSSPHHVGNSALIRITDEHIINFPPKALNIVWGGDSRYRNIPHDDNEDESAELNQVCWLEVTRSVNDTNPNKNYQVGFVVSLIPGAFGWGTASPIYITVRRGKDGKLGWTKVILNPSVTGSGRFEITGKLSSPVSNDHKQVLYFGLYGVWSGKWKEGWSQNSQGFCHRDAMISKRKLFE